MKKDSSHNIHITGLFQFLKNKFSHWSSVSASKTVTIDNDTISGSSKENEKEISFENLMTYLQIEPISLELGSGLELLIDEDPNGDLLGRVVMVRRQCSLDLGIIFPTINVNNNLQLCTNEYAIKIKGLSVAGGFVLPNYIMALSTDDMKEKLKGVETTEPTFGLPVIWIAKDKREKAEQLGYTTVDAATVISIHLTEIIKRHSSAFLTRQQVQRLIDNLKPSQRKLIEEVVPNLFSVGEIQKILSNLLRDGVSIRDMATILESLAKYGKTQRDFDVLTEYIRKDLYCNISHQFVPCDNTNIRKLDPLLEPIINEITTMSCKYLCKSLTKEEKKQIYKEIKRLNFEILKIRIKKIINRFRFPNH